MMIIIIIIIINDDNNNNNNNVLNKVNEYVLLIFFSDLQYLTTSIAQNAQHILCMKY